MSLDSILENILTSSVRGKAESSTSNQEKTASVKMTSSDAEGLVKISSELRKLSSEPTYEDLHKYIRGFYGSRKV